MAFTSTINPDLWEDIPVFGFTYELSTDILSTFGYHIFARPDSDRILDHADRAEKLLIEQFQHTAVNLITTVRIFANEIQEIENVLSELKILRTLDFATAAQLDEIGRMVGLFPRTSVNDDEYRADIRLQISLNQSSGLIETIIAYVRQTTLASFVQLTEIYPAGFQIFTNGITNISSDLRDNIKRITAGGVRVELAALPLSLPVFTFASESGIPVHGLGFSEDNYAPGGVEVGGAWAESYV